MGCLWDGLSQWVFFLAWERERILGLVEQLDVLLGGERM